MAIRLNFNETEKDLTGLSKMWGCPDLPDCLDYFLGNLDALASPGMGEWNGRYFKVLYSPTCDGLHTHRIVYDDGTSYVQFYDCGILCFLKKGEKVKCYLHSF